MEDFQFIAGDLAVDFVNTVADRLLAPRERLLTGADVDRWARQAGLLTRGGSLHLGAREVRRVRAVRECLYRVLRSLSVGEKPHAAALEKFNAAHARALQKHRVVQRGHRLTWEWVTERRDPDRLLGPILERAGDLIVAVPRERLRQCEDVGCGWLFLDRSRAGSRRWCRMEDCGNRAKARRHYEREHLAR